MAIIEFNGTPDARQLPASMYEKKDFTHLLEVWGDGDADRGFILFHSITMRLAHARQKHPLFADNELHALIVIGSEYKELEHAVAYEPKERVIDEAMDVAVTALRLVNGEHRDQ